MEAPVASTSAARSPSNSSSRRLPASWDRSSASSRPLLRARDDKTSSSDVELSDGFFEATGIRRSKSSEKERKRKRCRASVKGKERGVEGPSALTSKEATFRGPEGLREGEKSRIASSPSAVATPVATRRSIRASALRAIVVDDPVDFPAGAARLVAASAHASPASQPRNASSSALPPARPNSTAKSIGIAPRHPLPPKPPVPRPRSKLEPSVTPAVTFVRPVSSRSVPPALVPSRLCTPDYIRDLYAAPRPAAARPRSAVPRNAKPPRVEPKRGPAPLDLLFEGEDVKPGPAPLPPPALALTPALAPTAIPVSKSVRVEREESEEMRRRRVQAEAEEARSRSVWEATARACARPVADPAPPPPPVKKPPSPVMAKREDVVTELPEVLITNETMDQAVDEMAEDAVDETVNKGALLQELFSPPESPAPHSPAQDQQRKSMHTGPPAMAWEPARTTLRPVAQKWEPHALRSRSLSSLQPVEQSSDDDANEVVALPATRTRSKLVIGSPELYGGVSVRKEEHRVKVASGAKSATDGEGAERGAGKGKGKGKELEFALTATTKKKGARPRATLEPENSWWTRSLDYERATASDPPPNWLAPEQPGFRESPHRAATVHTLELAIREIVLRSCDIVQSTLEKGEWWIGMNVSLVCTMGQTSAALSEHDLRLRLILQPSDQCQSAHCTFTLDDPRPFSLGADPSSLARIPGRFTLNVTSSDGSVSLPVRQDVLLGSPFRPFFAHLPFRATSAVALHHAQPILAPTAPSQVPGITLSLVSTPLPTNTPPSPADVAALLSTRLERLDLERTAPSGVWIPAAVPIRGHEAVSAVMPQLDMSDECSGFDFLTKLPYAAGEPVRLFIEDTVETTRAVVAAKDQEISRSSLTPEEKLFARMQVRWCLVNPYPPTVYHRERACWVHYAPLVARFRLRDTLVLHLVRHLLAHRLVTQPQLREIVRAVDGEVRRVERGEREGYEEWYRKSEWETAQRA